MERAEMSQFKRRFSIVVPVYQNEANLTSTVSKLLGLQEHLPGYELDLVFVEDGSRDRSREILLELAEEYPRQIKVVLLTRNFGQTPAVQAGLHAATGDCIGIISCDLQEPYEKFIEMVQLWENGSFFVVGERVKRDESWWHQAISGMYWKMVRRLAIQDFPSMGYDFCLLDRRVVEDVNRINEKNSSIFVLIYWLGYRATRIPIIRSVRISGKSQWNLWNKLSFTFDTLIGFTYIPARAITAVGFILGAGFLFFLAISIGQRLLFDRAPPGWASIFALIAFLGAAILFSLGILSEYLLRILDEARKRPPYVVERTVTYQEK